MSNYLDSLTYKNPLLTNVARGHNKGDHVYPYLFPKIKASSNKVSIPSHGKDHMRIVDGDRAMNGEAPEILTSSKGFVDFTLKESAFKEPIDRRAYKRVEHEPRGVVELEMSKARNLREIQENNKENAASSLATNAANYGADNKVTLAGSDQWSHTDSDPYGDIITARNQLRKSSGGKNPDLLIIGEDAFEGLSKHKSFLNQIYGDEKKGVIDEEMLSKMFKMRVVIGNARVWDPETDTYTDLWTDNVVMAHTAASPGGKASIYTPAFGYDIESEAITIKSFWKDDANEVKYIHARSEYALSVIDFDMAYLIKDTVS